jgi:hypothetical protein
MRAQHFAVMHLGKSRLDERFLAAMMDPRNRDPKKKKHLNSS